MSKPPDAPLPTRNDHGATDRVILGDAMLGDAMLNPYCGGVVVVARGGDVRLVPLNIRLGGYVTFSPARAREIAEALTFSPTRAREIAEALAAAADAAESDT